MTEPRRMLFLHIPKTAGTSLKHFLFHRFPADDCLLDANGLIHQDKDLDRYAFVVGHVDYDFAKRYRRPPFLVTCLRRPVERALSMYYHLRSPTLPTEIQNSVAVLGVTRTHEILEELRRLSRYSLPEFLRHEPELARERLGNVQTCCLAGASAATAYAKQPERLLALAKEHLQACQGVLLTERLTESLHILCHVLGWDGREIIPHDNATCGRRATTDHDPELLTALADLSPLDAELYRFAEQLVEQRWQAQPTRGRAPKAVAEVFPPATNFTLDQPIRGSGWHIRERSPSGWYCWTGQEATLHLEVVTTGDHSLQCHVEHAANAEAWQGLEVRVNGHAMALTRQAGSPPGAVFARVPDSALGRTGRVCIGLRVPQTVCPWERDPSNPDRRRLGVAVSRLQLQPLEAAATASCESPRGRVCPPSRELWADNE